MGFNPGLKECGSDGWTVRLKTDRAEVPEVMQVMQNYTVSIKTWKQTWQLLTGFDNFCTTLTRNVFATKYSHLFIHYNVF